MTSPPKKDGSASARRRRSLWMLLALLPGFACIAGVFILCYGIIYRLQDFIAAPGTFFCTSTHWAGLVLLLASLCLSVPIGLIVANALLWTVPPIRRALNRGPHATRSFASANAVLAKRAGSFALIALPIYFATIGSEVCVSDSHIYYRPATFLSLQTYPISQLAGVRLRCAKSGRGGWEIGIDAQTNDDAVFELAAENVRFPAAAARIRHALRNVRSDASRIDPNCPTWLKKRILPP